MFFGTAFSAIDKNRLSVGFFVVVYRLQIVGIATHDIG